MIIHKQQFDWIIKTGCNLIGQKIDYLKFVSAIFHQIFIFHQVIALQKL